VPDLPAGRRLVVTAAAGAGLLNVNMTSSLVCRLARSTQTRSWPPQNGPVHRPGSENHRGNPRWFVQEGARDLDRNPARRRALVPLGQKRAGVFRKLVTRVWA